MWHLTNKNVDPNKIASRNNDVLLGKGVFGTAYSVAYNGNHGKYVRKIIQTPTENHRRAFMKEAQMKHGNIKVHAWRQMTNHGEILMDNFKRFGPIHMSLSHYIKKFYSEGCPRPTHPIYKSFYNALKNFYVSTQGYHGDLHGGNVVVILSNDDGTPESFVKILIADYGSHVPFKKAVNNSMCLTSILDQIHQEFQHNIPETFIRNKNILMYKPSGNVQLRRSNRNLVYKVGIKHGSPVNNSNTKKKMINTMRGFLRENQGFQNAFEPPKKIQKPSQSLMVQSLLAKAKAHPLKL